jgi:GDP-D-mannose 3',5'-epimerase
LQTDSENKGLKESDAYPLNPDSDYGLEKAFSERLFLAYQRNYNLNVRIARFHNIYGPEGTYKGGREKAPAAMCRKVIESQVKTDFAYEYEHSIEVWGDGLQTRSFLYIDDCIDAVRLLMQSDFKEPINIGSEEMVSINTLANMAIEFSGKDIQINNVPSNAIGVKGRNSDNTLIEKVLGWKPRYSLKEGLEKTFFWIKSQYNNGL